MDDEKVNAAMVRYMAAHVMMNCKCQLDLSLCDVQAMFTTLTPPAMPFDKWCELTGTSLIDEMAANESALEVLKNDNLVKIEDDMTEGAA